MVKILVLIRKLRKKHIYSSFLQFNSRFRGYHSQDASTLTMGMGVAYVPSAITKNMPAIDGTVVVLPD